jgi:hypothetical protein
MIAERLLLSKEDCIKFNLPPNNRYKSIIYYYRTNETPAEYCDVVFLPNNTLVHLKEKEEDRKVLSWHTPSESEVKEARAEALKASSVGQYLCYQVSVVINTRF